MLFVQNRFTERLGRHQSFSIKLCKYGRNKTSKIVIAKSDRPSNTLHRFINAVLFKLRLCIYFEFHQKCLKPCALKVEHKEARRAEGRDSHTE